MQTPERASDDDGFDVVLRELARPPELGEGFARGLQAVSTHPLQEALREAGTGHEPAPGDVLEGRYRIQRVLGRGGMGLVLEAEHLRAHKRVAIKWMSSRGHPERSAAQIARFLREAQAVANIQHPNVVDLYDVGDAEGTPFLVLERLTGESLRTRLGRGPMAWAELEPIVMAVLRGVEAVHRAGIVHRDLKPDNIFLARDGDSLVPKVLDFGVAAMRATSEAGLASLTNTGALLGTPSYMALEQLMGGEVDVRADIYALGVTMYEALTGRLPFEARSAPELAVQLATRAAVAPSRLVPGIDRRLDAILLRTLARDVAARPQHVSELARELAALRAPVAPRRTRLLRAGGALTLLLALGAGAASYLHQRPAAKKPPRTLTTAAVRHSVASESAVLPSSVLTPQVAAEAGIATAASAQANKPAPPSSASSAAQTGSFRPSKPRSASKAQPAPLAPTTVPSAPAPLTEPHDATKIQVDDF